MIRLGLKMLAGGAVLAGAMVGEAAAGCCPVVAAGCGCAPVLVAPVPPPVDEVFVVNQGPILSGPGPFLRQYEDIAPTPYPAAYPYVGPVFTGYPYGFQDSGGYPRGYYSPYTGYPYAEPAPRRAYRVHYRSTRAYPRYR